MSGDFDVDTRNLIIELESYSHEYALSYEAGMYFKILLQAIESEINEGE